MIRDGHLNTPVRLYKAPRGARIVDMFQEYKETYWAAVYDLFRHDLGVEEPEKYPHSQVLSIVEASFTIEERLSRFQKFC